MALPLEIVSHDKVTVHRVAPVRFARAVSGFSDADAPDLDDHGFLTSDLCSAHGPVVGVMPGHTVRVKVIRDRLAETAWLFPFMEDPSIAEIVHPHQGVPLNPKDHPDEVPGHSAQGPERKGDCIYIRGKETNSTKMTRLRLHLGSGKKPILAEMAVRVYPRLKVKIKAHWVTIHGEEKADFNSSPSPLITDPEIRNAFQRVNDVYAQAGIAIELAGDVLRDTVTTVIPRPGSILAQNTPFRRQGTVTIVSDEDESWNLEVQTLFRTKAAPGMLNVYFVGHFFKEEGEETGWDTALGRGYNRTYARISSEILGTPHRPGWPACGVGLIMVDTLDPKTTAFVLAHEIGHCLGLHHYDVGEDREDLWAHRDLMFHRTTLDHGLVFSPSGDKNTPARQRVGYGTYGSGSIVTGHLLMTRRLKKIEQSNQIAVARKGVLDEEYAPLEHQLR
jgi:hypothetical protein